jgi:hypothetical protein
MPCRAKSGIGLALAVAACGREAPRSVHGDRETATSSAEVARHAPCTRPARDTAWTPPPVGAARFVVNRATRGMASRVRWLLSPDSSALLVVDDPVGVENEAVPDGALFATERTGRVWRADSVWSVVPSPDWRRVAFGRAVVIDGGEAQAIDPARWTVAAASLARVAGAHPALRADSLRAHSFAASGMSVRQAVAATFVADVVTGAADAPVRFVSLGGWRLGWSCDGSALLVGDRPRRVNDDAPAAASVRVAMPGVASTEAVPAESAGWIDGPTLDIGAPLRREPVSPMRVQGRTIVMRAGRIAVQDARSAGTARDVGPGRPLAVTRNGRFILAIVPRLTPLPHESPDEAIVYRVP